MIVRRRPIMQAGNRSGGGAPAGRPQGYRRSGGPACRGRCCAEGSTGWCTGRRSRVPRRWRIGSARADARAVTILCQACHPCSGGDPCRRARSRQGPPALPPHTPARCRGRAPSLGTADPRPACAPPESDRSHPAGGTRPRTASAGMATGRSSGARRRQITVERCRIASIPSGPHPTAARPGRPAPGDPCGRAIAAPSGSSNTTAVADGSVATSTGPALAGA